MQRNERKGKEKERKKERKDERKKDRNSERKKERKNEQKKERIRKKGKTDRQTDKKNERNELLSPSSMESVISDGSSKTKCIYCHIEQLAVSASYSTLTAGKDVSNQTTNVLVTGRN